MLPDLTGWIVLVSAAVVFLILAEVYLHRRPKRRVPGKRWWGQGQ